MEAYVYPANSQHKEGIGRKSFDARIPGASKQRGEESKKKTAP